MSECLWHLPTELTPDEQAWLDEQQARRQEIARACGVPAYMLVVPAIRTTPCDVHEARRIAMNAVMRALKIEAQDE